MKKHSIGIDFGTCIAYNERGEQMMKGIIVNIRDGKKYSAGETVKKSQNTLIAMLEELVSEKDAAEKKRVLADEYGMVMTTELEGRIQIMCNWSESIEARSIKKERVNAIERMIKANATKEQIISYGYTEDEYLEAEKNLVLVNKWVGRPFESVL